MSIGILRGALRRHYRVRARRLKRAYRVVRPIARLIGLEQRVRRLVKLTRGRRIRW